jgi:hypothetical protein
LPPPAPPLPPPPHVHGKNEPYRPSRQQCPSCLPPTVSRATCLTCALCRSHCACGTGQNPDCGCGMCQATRHDRFSKSQLQHRNQSKAMNDRARRKEQVC